jgi:hypothetical protein
MEPITKLNSKKLAKTKGGKQAETAQITLKNI